MVRIFKKTAYTIALSLAALSNSTTGLAADKPVKNISSDSLPKWEVGIGAGAIHLPHYPGSNQSRNLGLALPYFIYRGDFLQASRSGIRTIFYNDENWKLDVSLGGSISVDSDDNDARRGMEDLDWIGEIGPRLSYTAIENDQQTLVFRLPIRAAFSTDFRELQYQGWIASFEAKHRQTISSKFDLTTKFSSSYADKGFHDYFYGVDSNEVDLSIGRQQYAAKQGYNGTALSASLGWRHKRWYAALYGGAESYSGAAFRDSPLFKQSQGLYAGAFVIWSFWHSDERVSRRHLIDEQ